MMHIWEGKGFDEALALIAERDPRRFGFGCATRNAHTTALQWFWNMPEIAQWLRRMEPQRWGLRGPDLIAMKAELEPVLTQVDVYGFSESARNRHNACTQPQYALIWWGHWADFGAGHGDWSDSAEATLLRTP